MPTKSALADTILEADRALASITTNEALVPSAAKFRAPLEEAVAELKGLGTRQQTLIADKQKVTQDLKAASRRVKELLIHVKAAVRSDIGPRSEKLVEFNVAPLRPRPRRATKAKKAETPTT
jgi:hypothetical protein